MMHGLDTGFLVAIEVTEHADHANARTILSRLLGASDLIAIAPQVLAEFIHIVTDPRRFKNPFSVPAARQVAEKWWNANDVVQLFPDGAATSQFLQWVAQYHLGRNACWTRCWPRHIEKLAFNLCSRRIRGTLACSACLHASHHRSLPATP